MIFADALMLRTLTSSKLTGGKTIPLRFVESFQCRFGTGISLLLKYYRQSYQLVVDVVGNGAIIQATDANLCLS